MYKTIFIDGYGIRVYEDGRVSKRDKPTGIYCFVSEDILVNGEYDMLYPKELEDESSSEEE